MAQSDSPPGLPGTSDQSGLLFEETIERTRQMTEQVKRATEQTRAEIARMQATSRSEAKLVSTTIEQAGRDA